MKRTRKRKRQGDSGRLVRQLLDEMRAGQPEAPDVGEMLSDALIRDAVRERASDVHIDAQREGALVRFRIDGVMIDVTTLDENAASRILNQLKAVSGIDPVNLFTPVEARVTHDIGDETIDMRVVIAPSVAGEKATVRLLEPERLERNIGELGMSEEMLKVVDEWVTNVNGLFLVTGPTGSGKTTTLYALLHELRLLDRSIVTLEDPVEYQVDGVTQLQVDREHALTFGDGLKHMLRLDPDLLLLGEVRDVASARGAATAASTGHAVLSTLHSHDPVAAVSTLRNWGLEDHEVTAALQVVVAQRLVRRLCPECREPGAPDERERRWLDALGREVPDKVWHAVGCEECRGLGYRGRVGLFEVWRLQHEELDAVAHHASERALRRQLYDRGHDTLLADGLAKVRSGETSLEELMGARLMRPEGGVEQPENVALAS